MNPPFYYRGNGRGYGRGGAAGGRGGTFRGSGSGFSSQQSPHPHPQSHRPPPLKRETLQFATSPANPRFGGLGSGAGTRTGSGIGTITGTGTGAAKTGPIKHPKPTPEIKEKVCENSVLTERGYSIPKACLSADEIEAIKSETTLTPKSLGPAFGPIGGNGAVEVEKPCPYWRENSTKIYLPRAYGIARYGLPYETRLSPGRKDVEGRLAFAEGQQLRDYQRNIVDIYLKHVRSQYVDFDVSESDSLTENGPISIPPIAPDSKSLNQTHPGMDAGTGPGQTPEIERVWYGGGGILEVPCGRGKCLARDTPVLMHDGTVKMVQDVVVGDLLMGDDSEPRRVLSLARGREKMYRISSPPSSWIGGNPVSESYVVNESHILSLKTQSDSVVDISVLEYLKYCQQESDELYGYRVPVWFDARPVEVEPYLLGYWLAGAVLADAVVPGDVGSGWIQGDAAAVAAVFADNRRIPHHYKCNSRKTRMELLAGIIDSTGYYCDHTCYSSYCCDRKCCEYCYEIVLYASGAGTGGIGGRGDCGTLLEDVMYLARSLGCVVERTHDTSLQIRGMMVSEIPTRTFHKNPKFRHARAQETPTTLLPMKGGHKYQISVTEMEVDDYYGFEINGNRRFLLGDYTVTHNTVMALKIVSELACPALVFVNKGFLADQWIERISAYLPKARVGRVQAEVFDIVDKDVVICMIQTLHAREYPPETFRDFGLTIIDECHRIGSAEYSRAMFHITTPNVLGISATVERKDGMHDALHLFIGPMLYSDKRQDGDCVQIRCVEYEDCGDDEYNKVETDFRGNVKYSTMMSKICEHQPRLDFLFRILRDLVEEYPESVAVECSLGLDDGGSGNGGETPGDADLSETVEMRECQVCGQPSDAAEFVRTSCNHDFCGLCMDLLEKPKCPVEKCGKKFTISFTGSSTIPGSAGSGSGSGSGRGNVDKKVQEEPVEYPGQNQIIVLAQYRSVLRELYKRIAQSGLATVGYYVGGMKQSDLNISTGKQIVLATYSMASEGLDVATLSTLVFATPRTDIKQSVGRILRRKHARFPVVVDVVDTHATFKNQASKRKTYYRSNGYDIWKCSYGGYLSGGMKGVGGSGPSGTGKWSLVFRAAAVAAAPAKGDAGGRGQSATVVPDSDEEDGDTRSGPNYRTMDCFILRHKK